MEKIKQLLEYHEEAKEECFFMLNELNSIDNVKMSVEDRKALKIYKVQLEKELDIRRLIVSDLGNLKNNYEAEEIYGINVMHDWALDNGYVKEE